MINTDSQLLKYIKYAPLFIVLSLIVIINIIIFIENENNLKNDLVAYKQDFIQTQKIIIKKQVEKAYNDILDEKKENEEELEDLLQSKIQEAYSIINNLYDKYKHKGKDEVIMIIKEALRDIRYNEGRGYFFIFDTNGKNILYPIYPELENISFLNHQDKNGSFTFKKLLTLHENNDNVFSEQYWIKPSDLSKEYKKSIFTKKFTPLNLIIGTGEYLSDFHIESKEHVLHDYIKRSGFGKNGYIFIIGYDGTYLSHPKKEYLGKNAINFTNRDGIKIIQKIIDTAKQGSDFISYLASYTPSEGKTFDKISFIKGFDEWNWAIGSGFYQDELIEYLKEKEKELKEIQKEYLTKTILISLVITLLLILIIQNLSKSLEKSFKNYRNRISNEIEENRKKEELLYQKSKMASMGEMLENIAHQWRQPLSAISTLATGIIAQKEFGLSNEKKEIDELNKINDSVQYLSETIDDFRSFFKNNKEKTVFDLQKTYSKTLKIISSEFQTNNIKIIEDLNKIELKGLENEVIQIIMNILNNAKDILEEKKETEKLIFIKIYKKDNIAILEIKDNGGGIPKNIMNRIFEPYFTTKHKSQGTGIGLYMSYTMVTKHLNGNLVANNVTYEYKKTKYKGACFTLSLPI